MGRLRTGAHRPCRVSWLLSCLALVCFLGACSESQVDVGSTNGASPATDSSMGQAQGTQDPGLVTSSGIVESAPSLGAAGKVIDFDTGLPVGGATVAGGGVVVLSAADGTYSLSAAVHEGDVLTASKEGYFAARSIATGEQVAGFLVCEFLLVATDSPNAPPPPPGD